MFNIFKKKKIKYPEFGDLTKSPYKDKYFVRRATWDWYTDEMINVIDPNQPRVITMDSWPQTIFLDADGQQTISEYTYSMASKYGSSKSIPRELDKVILSGVDKLLNLKIMALLDDPKALPYYLNHAVKKQDQEKAKKMMIEDGFIKE